MWNSLSLAHLVSDLLRSGSNEMSQVFKNTSKIQNWLNSSSTNDSHLSSELFRLNTTKKKVAPKQTNLIWSEAGWDRMMW